MVEFFNMMAQFLMPFYQEMVRLKYSKSHKYFRSLTFPVLLRFENRGFEGD